jgi:hypothetical protein
MPSRTWPSVGCVWPALNSTPASKDGGQFGFSVAGGRIRGHVDGIFSDGPADLGLSFPMLWECKTMNDKNWRETGQVRRRGRQAGLCGTDGDLPGVHGVVDSRHFRPPGAVHRDQQGYAGTVVRTRPVRRLGTHVGPRGADATEANSLPRGFVDPSHFECRFCKLAGALCRRRRCAMSTPLKRWAPPIGGVQRVIEKVLRRHASVQGPEAELVVCE